jgi:Kef-type K+ transport system membrane component KefB
MITQPLIAVGLLLLLGWWGGRAANALQLPRVSGYLVAGMLVSPSLTGLFAKQVIVKDFAILTDIALGVIAYSIGGSLVYERLQRLGKSILWITVSQGVGAFLVTVLVLLPTLHWLTRLHGPEYTFLGTHLPMALIIGAISLATAPGAVLAIISELRASGPFTTTLLGVIALDDGLAIIIYALAATLAQVLVNPIGASTSWIITAGWPLLEIAFSVLLGVLAGGYLKLMGRMIRRREALLMVILGTIFVICGVAKLLHLSALLANMVLGFFVVNWERRHHDFFLVVEQIEESLFGLFFCLAGAHLEVQAFWSAGFLIPVIMVSRMGGKQLGAWVGAAASQAPETVKRYLGLGLLPKAGVTVGLVLIAQEIFPTPVASLLVNAVIGSVILNELIAPPLVKYALVQAGETAMEGEVYEGQ